jgi:hypothetical protein
MMTSSALVADERPSCLLDATTGFPRPAVVPGVCLVESGPSIQLIQHTDEGLLLMEIQWESEDVRPRHPDGTYLLHLYDRPATLIYCPAELLDASSGTPRAGCLVDSVTMAPGADALFGEGRVQASIVVDPLGAAQCPSSLHVVGSLADQFGQDSAVRASLVLSPTSSLRADPPGSWPACDASVQELAVARPSPANELGRISRLDSAQWELVDELIRLNRTEWDVLRQLLDLSSEDLELVGSIASEDGAVLISEEGDVRHLGDDHQNAAGRVVPAATLASIFSKVTTLRNNQIPHIAATNRVIAKIDARIPSRPEVVAVATEFQSQVVSQIVSLIQEAKMLIGGLLETAEELRSGFSGWEGNNCGSGSGCADFKQDLRNLFVDLQDVVEFGQSLGCLDKPGLEIRQLDLGLVETLVIDRAPHVLLFALSKFLDLLGQANPSSGGWQTIMENILAEVPEETRSSLRGLCEDRLAGESAEALGPGGPVCAVLRPSKVGVFFKSLKARGDFATFVFKAIKEVPTDDKVVQATANVGAGGGAGTNAKNPAKLTVGVMAEVLDYIFSDRVLQLRGECLAMDAALEADLRSCSPPVSVLVDEGEWTGVETVLQLRIDEVRDCQEGGECIGLCPSRAECLLDEVSNQGRFPTLYGYLCDAYDALLGEDCQSVPECCSQC